MEGIASRRPGKALRPAVLSSFQSKARLCSAAARPPTRTERPIQLTDGATWKSRTETGRTVTDRDTLQRYSVVF